MTVWRRARLKYLASGKAGTWGSEPGEAGADVYCVRAADFDRDRFRVSPERLPMRSVDAAVFRELALQPGDLVLEKSGGGADQPVGGSVLFDLDIPAVCSNFATRLRPLAETDPRFLTYLMAAAYSRGVTASLAKQTTGIANLDVGAYMATSWRVPDAAAQREIANYLDAETTRINGLIELRRRIQGLLAERRRLATDRMLADSSGGVAWQVVKLKYVVRGFVDTLHATAPEEDDGPGYIVGTACIKNGSLNLAVARRCSTETFREWTKRALPQPGDVLLTREAPAGEAALVPAGIELAPGQRVVLVQTDRHRMLPELVLHSIYSARAGRFFDQLGRETTVAHLNMADIGELPVVLPPLEVQPVIAARIAAELASLDQTSSAMSRQVELLLERRQALITAAVAGQLDITGVAA
jgi:type I restriction enzyme S subunit